MHLIEHACHRACTQHRHGSAKLVTEWQKGKGVNFKKTPKTLKSMQQWNRSWCTRKKRQSVPLKEKGSKRISNRWTKKHPKSPASGPTSSWLAEVFRRKACEVWASARGGEGEGCAQSRSVSAAWAVDGNLKTKHSSCSEADSMHKISSPNAYCAHLYLCIIVYKLCNFKGMWYCMHAFCFISPYSFVLLVYYIITALCEEL